jgi:hypothetical protein
MEVEQRHGVSLSLTEDHRQALQHGGQSPVLASIFRSPAPHTHWRPALLLWSPPVSNLGPAAIFSFRVGAGYSSDGYLIGLSVKGSPRPHP